MSALARSESAAVGFVPDTHYAAAIADNRIYLAAENGDLCGFLFRGPWQPATKIYQTAIARDERLQYQAADLWLALVEEAYAMGVERISLHCATGLEANKFWRRLGLKPMCIRPARTATRRDAIRWEWELPNGQAMEQYVDEQLSSPIVSRACRIFGMTDRIRQYHRRKRRGK